MGAVTTPSVEELRALLASATPELACGTASIKAVESLLRAGYLGQKPRAQHEPRYAADAALIVAAVNILPAHLDRLATLEGENALLREAGEKFAESLEAGGGDSTEVAINQVLCCSGHDCGCCGSTVGEYLAYELRQAIAAPSGGDE